MKKKLVAVMGMLCLVGGVAYAGQSLVDFDGKDAKQTGSSAWAGERTTLSAQIPQPSQPISGNADKTAGQVQGVERKDSLKLPETCDEGVRRDLFRSVYFIDAQPMFSYEYLSRLQKCSSEEQVGYLLEYLGGSKTAAPNSLSALALKSPATRECTTSNGCRYCKECGYVCLKKEGDVCVKWSDKEVCWWELQYCTAK